MIIIRVILEILVQDYQFWENVSIILIRLRPHFTAFYSTNYLSKKKMNSIFHSIESQQNFHIREASEQNIWVKDQKYITFDRIFLKKRLEKYF